ncbi:MAG TPA: AbrB/MazE/SpoVT family DNA-binding domain-containing protein [Bacillus bacterium]|nr:AbrB/MazE/SpoVT family DNA-binding domain-containing protein [Bacillus sp. (in: firmicutes)]
MGTKLTERSDTLKERLTIRKRGQVTLPKSVMERFNLEEGDTLELSIDENGEIVIVPMVQVPVSQRWFWSEEWQKEEQEADKNIKLGHVTSFDNVDDALDWLDSNESDDWAKEEK